MHNFIVFGFYFIFSHNLIISESGPFLFQWSFPLYLSPCWSILFFFLNFCFTVCLSLSCSLSCGPLFIYCCCLPPILVLLRTVFCVPFAFLLFAFVCKTLRTFLKDILGMQLWDVRQIGLVI